MPSFPGIGAVGGLVRFATGGSKRAAATLAGVGAAVGVGVYALVKKRSAGEERSAYEPPEAPAAEPAASAPEASASAAPEPAIGGPDAEAAREIAAEPTSPEDIPDEPTPPPVTPVNEAMEEIAGEPTSPADVPGTKRPTGSKPSADPAPASTEPPTEVRQPEPHHALNNPVTDPDPTEWPDPYEKREDPRDPASADVEHVGEEPHVPTGSESTSEPPPSQDPEAGE